MVLMQDRKALAARLGAARRDYCQAIAHPDMSLEQFCERIGLAAADYAECEAGVAEPDVRMLITLHTRLGVSLDWLVVGRA